jgi:hypothetical protein
MIKKCLECGLDKEHTMDVLACDDHFLSKEEIFNINRQVASLIFGVKL